MMTLLGAGAGLSMPAVMTIAMSEATPSDAGLAGGLLSTSAQAGGALGLAVLATLATSRTGNLIARGEPAASALNGGYHLAFAIAAAMVAAAIALALTVLRPKAAAGQAGAERPTASASPAQDRGRW
jgi:hypothetical protein